MWLMLNSVFNQMQSAMSAGIQPTADQLKQFEANYGYSEGSESRILTMAGTQADIQISGVLTEKANFWAMYFGGGNTTYQEINKALAEADQNPDIKNARLVIDSPGGNINGLFECISNLQQFSKPLTVLGKNQVASAAFAIAAEGEEIVAFNDAVIWGSIGIVATIGVYDDEVAIASTKAPKKRPDVTTEAGKAVVREELDALHELFVDSIAAGRGTDADNVNNTFGQGGVYVSKEALQRGMIDVIQGTKLKIVGSKNTKQSSKKTNSTEAKTMDLQTLKADHPAVFDAARKEGHAEGVAEELDRSTAHLNMGEASGDMATAVKAVTEGTKMTATMQSKYMAAGMNRKDQGNRQSDDDNVSGAADNASDDNNGDEEDQVADAVEAKLGITA